MKASEQIKEFIKSHEGLRLTAYACPGGVLTIGYGHTGADVHPEMQITAGEANRLFEADLARTESALNDLIHANSVQGLTQGRFDALLSFAYNLGLQALRGSTLWRKIKTNPNDPTIPAEFNRWVYSKGKRLPGLVNRRQEEAGMWS